MSMKCQRHDFESYCSRGKLQDARDLAVIADLSAGVFRIVSRRMNLTTGTAMYQDNDSSIVISAQGFLSPNEGSVRCSSTVVFAVVLRRKKHPDLLCNFGDVWAYCCRQRLISTCRPLDWGNAYIPSDVEEGLLLSGRGVHKRNDDGQQHSQSCAFCRVAGRRRRSCLEAVS